MQRSVNSEVAAPKYYELGVYHQDLRSTCPDRVWSAVNKIFLYIHGSELKRFTGSWYLPSYLGGLGLSGIPTDFDLRRSRGIKELYGSGEKVLTLPSKKEWATWDLVHAHIRQEVPILYSPPYKRVEEELDVTPFILGMWSSLGADVLHRDNTFSHRLKTWHLRSSKLSKKARLDLGLDYDYLQEPKPFVQSLIRGTTLWDGSTQEHRQHSRFRPDCLPENSVLPGPVRF